MARSFFTGRPARFWLSCTVLLAMFATAFFSADRSDAQQAPTTLARDVVITASKSVDLRNAPPRGIFKWPGSVVSVAQPGQRFRIVDITQVRIPGGAQIWLKLVPISSGGRISWQNHEACQKGGGCWALWGSDPRASSLFRKAR